MDNREDANSEFAMESIEKPMVITEDIRSYLYDTAKWTKFLAIVGFIMSALIAMFAFGSGAFVSVLSAVSPGNPLASMGAGFLTVYFLVIALIYFYPSLLLFKNANATKKAVLFGDQESLSEAMLNMKSFFKFWGVLMIVLISFYFLVMVMAVVMGMGGAVGN